MFIKWRTTSNQYSVSPGLLTDLREEKKESKFKLEPQVSLSKDCSLSRPERTQGQGNLV